MSLRTRASDTFTLRPLLPLSSFMLAMMVGLVSSFTFSTVYDLARASLSEARQEAPWGVWHGQWQGVHAVTIRLGESGKSLSGTARFAKVVVTGDGLRVIGESAELPLVNPRLEGDKLSFEVEGADESHPVIRAVMEMRFTEEGEAELRRMGAERDGTPEEKPLAIRMKREQSF